MSHGVTIKITNDYAFKRIFGHEDTKDILASFLTEVLGEKVTSDITLENTEFSPEYVRDKASRLDVTARLATGEKINVEIQLIDEHNIDKRTLFYWGKYYTKDLGEGDDYRELKKTVSILIVDFEAFGSDKPEDYHSAFYALERKRHERFFSDFEIHVIELPKFMRLKKAEWIGLDAWMMFMKRSGDDAVMTQIMEKNPAIRKAMSVAEMMERDEKERWYYEMREKGMRDIRSIEIHAKEEGAHNAKIEMAKKLLARGVSLDIVAESSGLSIEEIRELQN